VRERARVRVLIMLNFALTSILSQRERKCNFLPL
jgi:hypothetical protein